MKILIPNATSPENIGDLAILTGLISVVGKNNNLKIHSTEHKLHKRFFKYDFSHTLYSWAVFEDRSFSSRVKKITELLINYFLIMAGFKALIFGKSSKLIKEYFNADLILFVGGGYLRSQKGIKQTLNLLMLLIQFQIAKKSSAKKIIAPISFGPFAYKWQEGLSVKILKGFDLISAREEISYKILKKYKVKNLIISCDTSFMLKPQKSKNKNLKNDKFVLGFTIREWLKDENQKKFENEFTESIILFSRKTKSTIQPIIQVDAPKYGDIDLLIAKNITIKLQNQGIIVKPIIKIKNIKHAFDTYNSIDLLLGVRMHSNILASLQGTPFVAVSYEHKTDGIIRQLEFSKNLINIYDFNRKIALSKLLNCRKYLNKNEKQLLKLTKKIRIEEKLKWKGYIR